jgi:SAM-dependent methyltransferase
MRLRRQRRSAGVEPSLTDAGVVAGLAPPSIWVGSVASTAEWHDQSATFAGLTAVFDGIDDRMMSSRHPFEITGWCAVCNSVQQMAMAWHLGGISAGGSVNPAWTLNACCHGCGLVSRMRALIEFIQALNASASDVFVAERVTESHTVLQQMYPGIVGAEYLGAEHESGRSYPHESGIEIRHEDMTALSFPDDSFDLVITQDVFEHIPDYRRAFAECRRVLRPDGSLVFTIPFFANLDTTEVRAVVDADGEVEHLLPPEIHGNPVGEGSLCFQHFGWDILDDLRTAGFTSARAHMYWGPWGGHLGMPMFVFEANG